MAATAGHGTTDAETTTMQANPLSTTPAAAGRSLPAARPGRRVIDAPTRMFHWLFALSFVGAYATGDSEHWRALHVTLGYTMAGLLGFRLVYGLIGPRHARLSLLWRKLGAAPAWLRSVIHEPTIAGLHWRQGQNLLMALAVVSLLALALPLTLSGYATYNDWGGGDGLAEVHEFFGNVFLAVVLAHLALILGRSVQRRSNQARPMITGRVDGAGPDLVKRDHAWLAALLLIAVLAFAAWQWRQAPDGLVPALDRAAAHSIATSDARALRNSVRDRPGR
jgi:cytochrome b